MYKLLHFHIRFFSNKCFSFSAPQADKVIKNNTYYQTSNFFHNLISFVLILYKILYTIHPKNMTLTLVKNILNLAKKKLL